MCVPQEKLSSDFVVLRTRGSLISFSHSSSTALISPSKITHIKWQIKSDFFRIFNQNQCINSNCRTKLSAKQSWQIRQHVKYYNICSTRLTVYWFQHQIMIKSDLGILHYNLVCNLKSQKKESDPCRKTRQMQRCTNNRTTLDLSFLYKKASYLLVLHEFILQPELHS